MSWDMLLVLVPIAPVLIGLILFKIPKTRRIGRILLGRGSGRGGDWARRQEQAREEDAAIASHDFESTYHREGRRSP